MSYRQEDRLELALRASNEGIWDWDLETGEIHYSGRILRFLGWRREEMPHLFEDPEVVHEEDREEFRRSMDRVLAPGGPELLALEPRFRNARGEWSWYRLRGVAVRDDEGRVLRMAGSMIDITRRKEAEGQLMEERHLMRLLIDSVPLNIYFKDRESRFTLVNQSMASWFGEEDPSEVIGKNDHDYFGAEHADQALRDEQQILETGEPIVGYVEKETGPGGDGEAWVLTTKMPLLDRKGKIIGTFGVSSDVSELVRTQQSLAETAAALQHRNNEIEEELALAREVQQALLPHEYPAVPEGVPFWERRLVFGHRYIPISGLAGDFFEVFPVGPDAVGLFICDVMGHGVRSAIIVSMLRGLAERAQETGEDPAEFLRQMNRGLAGILKKAEVTMFATAFFAVADVKRGEIRYASAGHPAAIVRTAGGPEILSFREGKPGPALGLFQDTRYRTNRADLEGIEQLLLFTDGITEVENPEGEAFLQNRLMEVVGEVDGGVEEVLDGVLERVLSFASSERFDDDVCLLGMEVRSASEGA